VGRGSVQANVPKRKLALQDRGVRRRRGG